MLLWQWLPCFADYSFVFKYSATKHMHVVFPLAVKLLAFRVATD